MLSRMRKLLPVLALLGALAVCSVALAATARVSAPKEAAVGNDITARASGLKPGRYALRIVADEQPARGAFCIAPMGKRKRARGGKVAITGAIPRRLTCYQGNGVNLGRIRTTPGAYHLIVSVPSGPVGSSPRHSFARRAFRVRR